MAEKARLSGQIPRIFSDLPPPAGDADGGPTRHDTVGAILVADVCGFTGLVEEAGRTRSGLETLARQFSDYSARVVESVHARGGVVLSITGDGFLCFWQATDETDLDTASARAIEGARAINSLAGTSEITDGEVRFRFTSRAGVGCGPLVIGLIGGYKGRLELVAGGPALTDAIAAERLAEPDAVVAAPGCWSLVSDRFRGDPVSGGFAVVTSGDLEGADGEGATEAEPTEIAAGSPAIDWSAEIRRVTVLVMQLPALERAAESGLEDLHEIVKRLQSIVEQFDGAISLNLDEKGVTVVVAFGLPGMAHGNDPERSIRVAQRLQEELARLDVRTGIGIATGPAFCGSFGSPSRPHYTIHGDVINLAAALMQSSASEILCHEQTAEAVRGRYTFEVLPAISVKGKQRPVRVYRPRAHRSDVDFRKELIGRSAERAILERHLSDVAAGESGAVTIEGEAGIGKSRLLAELTRRALSAGITVVATSADAIESNSPYHACRPIVAGIFGLRPDIPPDLVEARVRGQLKGRPDLQDHIPLLSAVLPAEIPDSEVTADMTGAARAEALKALITSALSDHLAGKPALLIVEDAQWLDSASRNVLLEVARSVRPLLTVLAIRTGEGADSEGLEALIGSAGTERILLGGLEPAEVDELVRQILGVSEIPASLGAFIRSQSAGHPLYCEELLHTMREMGVVRVQAGRCRVSEFESVELPTTIEGIILGRFDRLTAEEQLCLKLASVIGRVFPAELVRDVYPNEWQRKEVEEYLAALGQHNLTEKQTVDGQARFVFRHELIRTVVYGVMMRSQREPLHRGVAEWYERRYAGEELEPLFPLLAHHWAMASDAGKTLLYLEGAAKQALKRGAFEESKLFFHKAIALNERAERSESSGRVAEWESGLGSVYWYTGELRRSREYLEKAVERIDRSVPEAGLPLARGVAGRAVGQFAHRMLPGAFLGRRSSDAPLLNAGVDAYRVLGQIAYINGEPPVRMLYLTIAGLNLGEAAGPSASLARILINFGVTASVLGFHRLADFYTRRAIDTAVGEGRSSATAYVWHLSALIHAQRGNWGEALEASEKCGALLRRVGDENLEAELLIVRSLIHLCSGNFGAAPDSWRRSQELGLRNGNDQIYCWGVLQEVETLVGLGEIAAADEALDRALAVPTAETDGTSSIQKQRNLAAVRFHQGRFEEASAAAIEVVDRLDENLSTAFHAVESFAYAVEILVRCLDRVGDPAESERLEAVATDRLKRLRGMARKFWCIRPHRHLCDGLLEAYHGRRSAAHRAFSRAASLADEMEMPYDEALAMLEIAGLAPPADAAPILERAHALLRAAGAEDGPSRSYETAVPHA